MVFPTFQFLVFFVVVFPIFWWITKHRMRLGWLLLASCVFYMSWNPWLILLILFSASVDYAAALALEHTTSLRKRRFLLVGSISVNLGLLGFFKYANFFLDNTTSLFQWCGVEMPRYVVDVALPLGISFYTFETISYVVDVYNRKIPAVRNILDYALFIMFFPHLVAGPIVRPRDFLPQLARKQRFNWNRLYLGCRLFLIGLFKKSVLADGLGTLVVDPVFKDPAAYGSLAIWLGVLGYAVQIYCDFSGYSDMAIGLAHAFGFKLPANFNYPYLAVNIADFWRRWHVSLSSWLRDYLYKPLGGNRGSEATTYRNLLLVMFLGGLWHGANWTFIAWGLYHGVLLALHRALPKPGWLANVPGRMLSVVFTFLLVCVGWVFFRAQTFTEAGVVLQRMILPTQGLNLGKGPLCLVALSLGLTFLGHWLGTRVNYLKWERRLPAPIMGAGLAAILLLALLLIQEEGRTFIYFQF